jgi:predicted MPP superfamily phosphohydrolase
MRYLFLLQPVLITAALHVYLWRRLLWDTRLPPRLRRVLVCLLIALCASIPSTYLYFFRVHSAHRWHFAIAYGWLGYVVFVTVALLGWDSLRAVAWLRRRARRASASAGAPLPTSVRDLIAPPQAQETRRVFMARAAASSALFAAGGVSAYGVRAALWDITTPEVGVGLARLPRALDGYTIALLSDIHIGQVLDGRFLRHLVEETNRMRPDAIAICGDLVDGRVVEIADRYVSELRHLRARNGVYFVTGNHEYYWSADEWIEFVGRLGVRVLMNERVTLGDARRTGAQFDLAGVPDYRAARTHPVAPDALAACFGRDDQRELVMLAHQPVQIADSARAGAGLQLSGHTHGGQINPFGAIMALSSQPYFAGLHRHPGSDTQVYVSRGSGFWGPPMRVLAPAEITRIRLYQT